MKILKEMNEKAKIEEEKRIEKYKEEERKQAELEAEFIKNKEKYIEKYLDDKNNYALHFAPYRFQLCSFDNYRGKDSLKRKIIEEMPLFLFLYGTAGTGKTHLAISYMRETTVDLSGFDIDKFKSFGVPTYMPPRCGFITLTNLLIELRSTFEDRELNELDIIKKYSECENLIIDDIGIGNISGYAIDMFFSIVDNRYGNCKRTVLTSNLSPNEIVNTFSQRMSSRICSGMSVEITGTDNRLVKSSS